MTLFQRGVEAKAAASGTGERGPVSGVPGRAVLGPEGMAGVAASILGMSVPLAVGVCTGHVQAGMVAALSGLSLEADGSGGGRSTRLAGFVHTIIAGSLGMWAGSSLGGRGLIWFGIPAMAGAAAMLGNMSYNMARSSVLFVLFTIIASSLPAGAIHTGTLVVLFSMGAIWTTGIFLLFSRLLKRMQRPDAPQPKARRKFPVRLLLGRWWWTLKYWAGWQYAIRLALCLFAAQTIDRIWVGHRGYWIGLTVIIVVQRNVRGALRRTLERALGTVIGVLLISLALLGAPPVWAMIAMIAILGGLRPVLLSVNYTAYAAVMTPLVIILLDFGGTVSRAVVIDRLIATLAGCAISLTIGYIGWSKIPPLPDFRSAMQKRLRERTSLS